MKINILVLLSALFTHTALFAQNVNPSKKVLDAVSAKVKASSGITAMFTLKTISAKGKTTGVQTGTIKMKADKYLLNKEKNEVLCDGTKVYTYDGNKTVTVATVAESNSSLSPQKLLSGSYDKDYTYSLVKTTDIENEIEVKPLDTRKNFVKVNLYINKKSNMITKAKVLDKSNNTTELTISKLEVSAILSDNMFIFDKNHYPKDTEILD